MRLKILLNIGAQDKDPVTDQRTGLPLWLEGQVVDVGDDKEYQGKKLSEYLIQRSIAVQTEDEITPLKSEATPTKPAVFKNQPTAGSIGGVHTQMPVAEAQVPVATHRKGQ
jgi:hypothetical protein